MKEGKKEEGENGRARSQAAREKEEREGGRLGGRGKEERQTTQTAAGEGEKLPNAEEGKRETESKRANGMGGGHRDREREQRGRDRETPTQTDRRMIVPPATTGRTDGRKAGMAPAAAQLWHFQPCVDGRSVDGSTAIPSLLARACKLRL